MRLSYKRLGDYIVPCNEKNVGNVIKTLQGISNRKYFQKAKTNTIGVDLSKYRVVRTGQFAFNRATTRNGDKISIALRHGEDCIVSPSYRIFKSKDENILNSEYLMMWFKRPDFDRYARFKSHGSAHEFFDWDEMQEVELPIPSIEKQRLIVAEYNTIVNRIKLNETLNQKLEDTAQALYKHWFVDFNFPITKESCPELVSGAPELEGKPYKSSGGKMVYNEELDVEIPEGWEDGNIESLCDIIDGDRGKNYPSQEHFSEKGHCLFLNAGNVSKIGFDFKNKSFISENRDELLRKGKLNRKDIVLTSRGTVGNIAFYSDLIEFNHLRINSGMVIFRAKEIDNSIFIYSLMRSEEMARNIETFMSGSAQPQLPIKDIKRIPVLIPNFDLILSFSDLMISIQNHLEIQNKENRKLLNLKDLLLSKMSKVESDKELIK